MSLGRVLLVSLAVLAVGFGLWRFWWSALDHNPQQDTCMFGTVTNSRYLELLADAKRRQGTEAGVWGPLSGGREQRADQLRYRMEDITAGMTSLYERLAAVHAVLRAAGGHVTRSVGPDGPNGYWRPGMDIQGRDIRVSDGAGAIALSLDYALFSPNINEEISLTYPRNWVVIALQIEPTTKTGTRQIRDSDKNEFYVKVQVFAPIALAGTPPTELVRRRGLHCAEMLIPSPAYAEAFDAWAAKIESQRRPR
jgi:hypothetical protein